jgi:hypothetical protein
MSLLPNQIIPQTVPFGRVSEDGLVIIQENWWLLIYQLCEQVPANGQGATTAQLANMALLKATGPDYERQIADLQSALITAPNPAGRIAALEKQVADLTLLVASLGA